MARDVFISHSAQDKAVADAVCAALEAAALRCWVAPRDVRPGHSFAGEITRAIRQSKVMVLIFSGHSNKSEQVLREVQLATDCHLPIVRFRIEDVALTDDLTYFLSSPHWLDALTPPLSKHIATLELAVKELLGQSAEDTDKNPPDTVPPVDSMPTKEREIVAEKSSNRWKLLAIAAVVIFAAIIALILLWQPTRPGIHKYEPTPSPTSPLARPPEPTQSPTSQPAQTTEVTPVFTPTPRSSAAANQPGNAGPAPRNNRSWEEWMNEFVHNFVASDESNDLDLGVSFYSPSVDLYEEGWKSIDSVRHDIETYKARWPTRRATIRGDVRRSEKVPNRIYAASFPAGLLRRKSGKWGMGKGHRRSGLGDYYLRGNPENSFDEAKASQEGHLRTHDCLARGIPSGGTNKCRGRRSKAHSGDQHPVWLLSFDPAECFPKSSNQFLHGSADLHIS